jgi:hypothetical protein
MFQDQNITSAWLTPPSDDPKVWQYEREAEWSDAWKAFDEANEAYMKAADLAIRTEDEVVMQEHLLEAAKAARKAASANEWLMRDRLVLARQAFFAVDKDRDLAYFSYENQIGEHA